MFRVLLILVGEEWKLFEKCFKDILKVSVFTEFGIKEGRIMFLEKANNGCMR